MKKRILVHSFTLFLLLVLVGCGSGKTEPEQTMPTEPVMQATQQSQQTEPTLPPDPIDLLTDHQRNVLAMYNHLAVVTQEINENENGRIYPDNGQSYP